VPNAVEAMSYTRTDSPMTAARALAERVGLVVVTCGSDGAIAIDATRDEVVHVPSVPVDVVDPTGAGDVFVASWMVVADEGWSLADGLRFAALCAAISLQGLGGARSAPRPSDLVAFLRDRRPPGEWAYVEDWARRALHPDPAVADLPAARP
jgi:sugar/nucleoside kinase (ribokinase family)